MKSSAGNFEDLEKMAVTGLARFVRSYMTFVTRPLRMPSLYESIHGTAPDIVGQGIANPISMILSVAMMLRDSFGRYEDAERVERAVEASLAAGVLTRDIGGQASTKEMTEAIIARL